MVRTGTIVMQIGSMQAALFVLMISICLTIVDSQLIMKSYPLAINFDDYGTNNPQQIQRRSSLQINMLQNNNPLSQRTNFKDYEKIGVRQSKRNNDINPKTNRPASTPYRPNNGAALLTKPISNVRNCDNCSSQTYRKRTLNTDNGDRIKPDEIESPNYNGEPTNLNKSSNDEAKKLLLLRQKMIDMQGRNVNVSIEDTNWKIAANCLSNQFGAQFIRNRDVKCASSQVVLSISRMQRAGCKYCEAYFHCEGFSNALRRCRDNYDVQDTLNVMRECPGLINNDPESFEATKDSMSGADCQKKYLCSRNCMYNPSDGTCPRNNCFGGQFGEEGSRFPYRNYLRNRKVGSKNMSFPAGSPLKERILAAQNRGDLNQ